MSLQRFLVRISLQRFLGTDFSSILFAKNFLFRDFLEEVPLQNFFGRELVNHPFEILGTDFSAEIFW